MEDGKEARWSGTWMAWGRDGVDVDSNDGMGWDGCVRKAERNANEKGGGRGREEGEEEKDVEVETIIGERRSRRRCGRSIRSNDQVGNKKGLDVPWKQ